MESSQSTTLREVTLPRKDLQAMLGLVRVVEQLAALPAYRKQLSAELPEVARFDPQHHAVMMGYDFHIGPDGPGLIEVNTNAGGGLLALQAGLADTTSTPAMLTKRPPLLCQQCHSASGHPGEAYTSDDMGDNRDSRFMLARGCMNCHSEVHGSNHPSGSSQIR